MEKIVPYLASGKENTFGTRDCIAIYGLTPDSRPGADLWRGRRDGCACGGYGGCCSGGGGGGCCVVVVVVLVVFVGVVCAVVVVDLTARAEPAWNPSRATWGGVCASWLPACVYVEPSWAHVGPAHTGPLLTHAHAL